MNFDSYNLKVQKLLKRDLIRIELKSPQNAQTICEPFFPKIDLSSFYAESSI